MAFDLLRELTGLRKPLREDDSETAKVPASAPRASGLDTLVQTLFAARTQAHRLHLLTASLAQHEALQEFYEDIVPLIDRLAEAAQGKYGLLAGILDAPPAVKFSADVYEFKNQLCDLVCTYGRSMIPDEDQVLNTIFDEIAELTLSLKYKLENLS